MSVGEKALSATAISRMCGISRGTVGYWIRTRKLHADRRGNRYVVPFAELVHFLKATGQRIPPAIAEASAHEPVFREAVPCWEYWQAHAGSSHCGQCPVRQHHVAVCFEARPCHGSQCAKFCSECRYYHEFYLPRVQFVHQIDRPAAVCRGFSCWGGNDRFASLSKVAPEVLVGMGMERILHPDSLEAAIGHVKRRSLGLDAVPMSYSVLFKDAEGGGVAFKINEIPLKEPSGASLMVVEAP